MNFRKFCASVALGIVVLLGVVACGGGGGSEGGSDSGTAENISANGIWEGTFTEKGVGQFAVSGLLYDGRIIAISQSAEAVYNGTYTIKGNTISGTITGYEINGGPFTTTTISGTVTEEESISLSFDTSYGTKGTISLSFNDIYNRGSSLSKVDGMWSYVDGGYDLTITVHDDGTLWGQDSEGCVVSGAIELLDTAHNLYKVTASLDSCGNLNGSYTGFAALFDNRTKNDTLKVVVSNNKYILYYPFTRQ